MRAALSHRHAALAATLCVSPQGSGFWSSASFITRWHPSCGVLACGRLSSEEIGIIRGACIPVQCISGCSDLCAGRFWVSRFADALGCRHILVGESPFATCMHGYGVSNDTVASVQCRRVIARKSENDSAGNQQFNVCSISCGTATVLLRVHVDSRGAAVVCEHVLSVWVWKAEGGHAGICLESCAPICVAVEEIVQTAVRAA